MNALTEVDSSVYDKDYYLKINDGWREFEQGKLPERLRKAIAFAGTRFNGKKILDIGFGRGELLIHLAKQGAQCFGIDYSKASVEIATQYAKEQKVQVSFLQQEVKNMDFPQGFFDVVFMLDVVEHLTDEQLEKCLDSIEHSLSKDGVVVIHTMPNKFLAVPFYLVSKLTKTKRGVNQEAHVNEQTPFSLKKKLQKFNTQIIMDHEKNYFKNTQFYATHRTKIKPLVDLFLVHDFSKIPVLNLFLAAEIWVVCRKKKE